MAFGDLSIIIEHAQGGVTRLAWDEFDADGIPQGLTFGTTSTGGPSTLQTSFLRVLGDPGPCRLFDMVRVVNDRGRSIWEGRLAQAGRAVKGDVTTIAVSAQGWAAALENRKDARFLGIDRDLANWQSPTNARQIAWLGVPYKPTAATTDGGQLKFVGTGAWASTSGRPVVLSRYVAPSGLNVGRLMFTTTDSVNLDYDWAGQINALPADELTVTNVVSDWITVAGSGVVAGSQPSQDAAINAPIVELAVFYSVSPITDADTTRSIAMRELRAVGDHDLPLVTQDGTQGLLVSDCIPYWLETFEPQIRPGRIPSTVVPIPDFKFPAPTTPGSMITTGLSYHGWTWGVWEDKRLDIMPWGEGKTWKLRALDPGVEINDDGAQAVDTYSGLVVTYQDASGNPFCVGPTGALADFTDDRLLVTDPSNDAVAAGEWRVDTFDMGVVSTQQLATTIGQVVLEDRQQAVRSGTATVQGSAVDDAGQTVPVSEIRATEQAEFLDDDVTPRRIVETSYDHSTRTVTLTFDNGLQSSVALLAHLQARVVGA